MREFALWIGGRAATPGTFYELRLPFDGQAVARVAQGSQTALEEAMIAAQSGASAMAALSNAERSDLLFNAATLIKRDRSEFAELLTLETGKPIKESRIEAERAEQTLIASAIAARELAGESIPIDGVPAGKGRMAMTIRQPLGVIGAITPFNIPLNLALHKLGPALAGGNAVVHKPSEQTPLSAIRLAQLMTEAGAPSGAYNVVTGDGATIGQQMIADPRIAMITFTGSVPVGKEIRAKAGLKRVTLELGGNGALIIEADADLVLAVERSVAGSFNHSGQVCISTQRIFLHDRIADDFTERFIEATQRLKIGHPMRDDTDISSLISEEEARRVEAWIAEAVAQGARVLTGGQRMGATITPAILEGVPPDARIACDEAFGPVVLLYRYSDLDKAIEQANNTRYGLQSGIFTSDLSRAFQAARKLRSGGILINDIPGFRADNMPYGGVKESGIGREGPRYAIEEMTELKLICWRA